jgi:predicted nucleotide-binding protein
MIEPSIHVEKLDKHFQTFLFDFLPDLFVDIDRSLKDGFESTQRELVGQYFRQLTTLAAIAFPHKEGGQSRDHAYRRIRNLRTLFDRWCDLCDQPASPLIQKRQVLNRMEDALAKLYRSYDISGGLDLSKRGQATLSLAISVINETIRSFLRAGPPQVKRFAERNTFQDEFSGARGSFFVVQSGDKVRNDASIPLHDDNRDATNDGFLWSEAQQNSASCDHHERGNMTKPKVFLVHGRESGSKHEVARFLEKIGLDVVILHERAHKGRTLIVKFQEEGAGLVFAVVLMTGDDVGRLRTAAPSDERPRARQNVVFELGFFIGRLGPERVCALIEPNVDKPSDLDGIAYVSFDDSSDWQRELARELKAAKVPFDPSRML